MEAKGLFTFKATRPDELSFKEGDLLKVRKKEGEGWYSAEMNGKEGFVPATYLTMEDHLWYKGNISRSEAEKQLLNPQPGCPCFDGQFLIRDCQTDKNQFSLSVLHEGRPQHFKILSTPTGNYYLWPDQPFPSINKLIDYHRTVSVAREPNSRIFLKEDEICLAKFPFEPHAHDELPFQKGERIRILDKSDPHWWKGECLETGKIGYLPYNYVDKL